MGSSEIVDSGRFPGGRSCFSQTCTLLSQYLKENGSFGDLSLGLSHNKLGPPTETMNLLPMIEKSRRASDPGNLNTAPFGLPPPETQKKSDLISDAKPQAETAQMTIFYGGKVIVFDDFPAEKAKQIMTLASKSSAAGNHPNAAFSPPRTADPTFGTVQEPPRQSLQPPLDSDLPIARKHSLTRFLEKRRDRITEKAPYSRSRPAAAAAAAPSSTASNSEAWLGLTRQLP